MMIQCDTTCRTFNQAENKICSRCGSERCPECQAPRNTSFPFITYTYMYICVSVIRSYVVAIIYSELTFPSASVVMAQMFTMHSQDVLIVTI
jgi:hypothetical protein